LLSKESLFNITGTVITVNQGFRPGSEVKFSINDIIYFGNMFRIESQYWKDFYIENGLDANLNEERLKVFNSRIKNDLSNN
jgi:hypothetical protein